MHIFSLFIVPLKTFSFPLSIISIHSLSLISVFWIESSALSFIFISFPSNTQSSISAYAIPRTDIEANLLFLILIKLRLSAIISPFISLFCISTSELLMITALPALTLTFSKNSFLFPCSSIPVPSLSISTVSRLT